MEKAKKLTLRQRLREDAEKKLDALTNEVYAAAEVTTKGTSVAADLLLQLAGQPRQGKTLRNRLVTALANDAEADLERLYESQRGGDNG